MAEEGPEVPVDAGAAPAAPAAPQEVNVMESLKGVLRKALQHDGLKRGLHECAKVLERRTARLCCLATDCDMPAYKQLVKALCDSNKIPMIEVEKAKELGEWSGLCKLDADGAPRKVVGCACACVVDYGEDTNDLQVLLNYLKKQG